MVNKEILGYLKTGVSKGFSVDLLKKKLLEKGFPQAQVNEAVKALKNTSKETLPRAPTMPKQTNAQQQPVKQVTEKAVGEVPTGVKICSILYYIQAVLLVVVPISIVAGAAALFGGGGAVLGGLLAIILLVIGLPFAVLFFFVARGLHKLKNWARIVAIIFGVIGLLGGISQLIGGRIIFGILYVLISGFIAGYLLFSKTAKQSFA